MANKSSPKAIQKSLVTLEEAFDLNEPYIRGVYFPDTHDLLGQRMIFDFDEREAYSLISPRAYAIKRNLKERKGEVLDIGALWNYKFVLSYIVEHEKLERTPGIFNWGKYAHLRAQLNRGIRDRVSELKEKIIKVDLYDSGNIRDDELSKLGFFVNQEELEKFTSEKREILFHNYYGGAYVDILKSKGWEFAVCQVNPNLCGASRFRSPKSTDTVIMAYEGDISLTERILREQVKPTNIGNGVIVMNQDRFPKYLQRTLGLGGK